MSGAIEIRNQVIPSAVIAKIVRFIPFSSLFNLFCFC
jgi:hypothetical protein